MSFQAILAEQTGESGVSARLQELHDDQLPEGNVTVAVEYTTINYKDGLCMRADGGLVRNYPHVPGIDFAGTVESSEDPRYQAGERVVLTGWGVGERHWGGFSQKARVNADWLVPLPEGLDTRNAMAIGTAGFAAMLARVIGQLKYGASVAAVGLAGGASLPASVLPFLLRGVNLLGIDSVRLPFEGRIVAWQRLASDLPLERLGTMIHPAGLADIPRLGADILESRVQGRVVVEVNS